MNLLESQFERLVKNPNDKKLLKQLSVEFGSKAVKGVPEAIREFRILAASALKKLEENLIETNNIIYAKAVLSALLDSSACAEDAAQRKLERTHLEVIQEAYDAVGVNYVIRYEKDEENTLMSFLFLTNEKKRSELEKEDLDYLCRNKNFIEFSDGTIASY